MGSNCCAEERETKQNEGIDHDVTLEKTINEVVVQTFDTTGNDSTYFLQGKEDLQVIVRHIRDLDYIFEGMDGEIVNQIWTEKKGSVGASEVAAWLRTEIHSHEGNIKALFSRAPRVLYSIQQLPGYGHLIEPQSMRVPLKRQCKLLEVPKAEMVSVDQIQAVAQSIIQRRSADDEINHSIDAASQLSSMEAEDAFIVLLTLVYANYFRCKKRLNPPSPCPSNTTVSTSATANSKEDESLAGGSGTSHAGGEKGKIGEHKEQGKTKEEEEAAVKIQSVHRGNQARKDAQKAAA